MVERDVKEISYFRIVKLLGPDRWRCHVFVSDGSHYTGEGYTKEEAKENALDVKRAND